MNRTTLAILIGLLLALAAAQVVEGELRVGLIAGYLCGGAIGIVGADIQRRLLVSQPKQFMLGSIVSFMLTMLGVMTGILLLRYVDALAAVADYRYFAIAFACAAFIGLVVGALDNVKVLKEESAL